MFAFVITYSFDSDYVAHVCETREEAEALLRKYINDEYKTVCRESEYEPIIRTIESAEDYQEFWYTPNGREVGTQDADYAVYRVFDLSHNYLK